MTNLSSPSPYEQALAFLYDRIDYERTAVLPYRSRGLRLDRMRDLAARLGSPQDRLAVVHIAGTKGKGSTAAMIASVLKAAGYRTGLYTSPHLHRLEERLAIDGQACSEAELVELIALVRPTVEAMDREAAAQGARGPTFFEITTVMALAHFVRRGVDVAVLEVGLGGRLDSTNICRPLVSVITSISFDHTRQLGNTLALIAAEKAGIIKPGIPVVSGVEPDEPRIVVEKIANQNGSELRMLGRDFVFTYCAPPALDSVGHLLRLDPAPYGLLDYREASTADEQEYQLSGLALGLLGRHQAANAAVALAALRQLTRHKFHLPEDAIRCGLAQARCPARIEVVSQKPVVVIDAAHNVASIEALVQVLDESFLAPRRLLVFAATKEKDVRGMLRLLLPRFSRIIFTRYANNPRSVDPEEVARLARELSAEELGAIQQDSAAVPGEPRGALVPSWTISPTPAAALDEVLSLADAEHLICFTGSFFLAAEVRELLDQNVRCSAVVPEAIELRRA